MCFEIEEVNDVGLFKEWNKDFSGTSFTGFSDFASTSPNIINNLFQDHEFAKTLVEFREKAQKIDFILTSPDFNIEEKQKVMNSLRTLPIQEVEIPSIKCTKFSRAKRKKGLPSLFPGE